LLSALGGTTPQALHLTGSIWMEEEEADTSNNSTIISQRYHLSQQDGDIAMLSQHDNFFSMLTPRETLEFTAYLESQKQTNDDNRNNGYNHKEEARRKLASLGLLGVADRQIGDRNIGEGSGSYSFNLCKLMSRFSGSIGKMSENRSGGLSGGERRRLSVALELVSTNLKVFFADEPTTGLDSSQAGKVVDIIAKLAKERNVPSIMSLHQPKSSIWKTLDQVILLAPGGKMCYSGSRSDAISYFASIGFNVPADTNPAEYLIDLVSIDSEDLTQAALDHSRIDLLHQQCIKSLHMPVDINNNAIVQHQQTNKELVNGKSLANSIRRFAALLRRSWRQNIRNFHIIGKVRVCIVSSSAFRCLI
jgi:ABC-type multidrug transport system ATPase subunit